MSNDRTVLFGLGLEGGVDQVGDMLAHARIADEAGIDIVSVGDHPAIAERLDAYALLGFVLGATKNVTAAAIMTNLLSRPAPVLARTLTSLSTISGGRVAFGVGAGGSWDEIVTTGVPRWQPGQRVRALEEAITLVRALSGGGDPVTFDGEFYHVTDMAPAAAPTPPIWVGALGPKTLAVTGRCADAWIPGHLADWRSTEVAEGRRIVDDAAAAAGRDPAEVGTIYNVSGPITRDSSPHTRDEDGRWIGGSVAQWVDELTYAALECHASAFSYLLPPAQTIDDTTLSLWAREIVPAVREAVAQHREAG